ncbi:DNA repair protein RadC [Nitratiruptor sp. YY09-18]|uniref:RadC family protein n=1 Tax=Nitratiruptor sp. YY09-18 TaxID=2724901 RepID=UPI001938D9BC|nr:DNA repair protein RadC [Nitratiruptor sp. YY09-18]BCD68816.1 DNA repair protein RadC [Nitratiruptor sp. YY09-18]
MRKMCELEKFEKPREKLLEKGVKALKDYELVAILLGSGVKGKDVIKLSREIIKLFQQDFDGIDIERLLQIHGLGIAKAAQIVSAIELSKRYLLKQHKTITSPKDVYEELKEYFDKKQEYFIAFYLDGAKRICEKRVITIGTLNQSLVHPREVFAPAIENRCASIIVAHNHPSNNLTPSKEDVLITERLKQSGKILGIELLDHIIFSKEGFVSLQEEGIL